VIAVEPIGFVRSSRSDLSDDNWGAVTARIEVVVSLPAESLDGIEAFSHAEVVNFFDRVSDSEVERGARHPRGNIVWPKVGILAQRGKGRPNRLGVTIVEVIRREGRSLTVGGLDAIGGTPVLDIKPVLAEFLPRTPVRQPELSRELLRNYKPSANCRRSSAAGTSLHLLAFWPDHSGKKSPLPRLSAFDRSVAMAKVANGKAGAATLIGPNSLTTRFTIPRVGLPVNTFVTAVCRAPSLLSAARCTAMLPRHRRC
jgi:tRNA (Thr-GGU) A37 N-methylase